VAYDVAFALVNGGVLPKPCWSLAVETFGGHGANELVYLVGLYSLVSMTLNGFDADARAGLRDWQAGLIDWPCL
jgi:hypothetical protein